MKNQWYTYASFWANRALSNTGLPLPPLNPPRPLPLPRAPAPPRESPLPPLPREPPRGPWKAIIPTFGTTRKLACRVIHLVELYYPNSWNYFICIKKKVRQGPVILSRMVTWFIPNFSHSIASEITWERRQKFYRIYSVVRIKLQQIVNRGSGKAIPKNLL